MKTGAWRFYRDYLMTNTREEAEALLRKVSEVNPEHIVRLAVQFAGDYGRLPDELHNMIVLTGGPDATKYLERLAQVQEKK
mgnify:FL=1